jgi:hypothetical protein
VCVCVCVCVNCAIEQFVKVWFWFLNVVYLNAWGRSVPPKHVACVDGTANMCCGWRHTNINSKYDVARQDELHKKKIYMLFPFAPVTNIPSIFYIYICIMHHCRHLTLTVVNVVKQYPTLLPTQFLLCLPEPFHYSVRPSHLLTPCILELTLYVLK